MIQLIVAFATGSLEHATRPAIAAGLGIVFVSESVLIIRVLARRRSPEGSALATADVVTMCVLLLGQRLYAPAATLASTWDGWAFGVTLSTTLLIGMAYRHSLQTTLAAGGLVACYLAAVLPAAVATDQLVTVLANALGYLINSAATRLCWRYITRLASAADRAQLVERQRDQTLRTQLEARQTDLQHTLHDQAAQLVFVARLLESGDARAVALLGQATSRARLALVNDVRANDGLDIQLIQMARSMIALDVVCTVDRLAELRFDQEASHAVVVAVRTLLINVQNHANASKVVIHGYLGGTNWTLTVHDDGVGFDTATTPRGYGLQNLVVEALAHRGVAVTIESLPGLGTTVTLQGDR